MKPDLYTSKGKTAAERRDAARSKLAISLLWSMVAIVSGSIIVGSILLYFLPTEKFSFKDMLNLILGVSSIFSGLLGAAITYYFFNK